MPATPNLPLERLRDAIRENDAQAASELLERHPDLGRSDLGIACALGDVEFVTTSLANDPTAAERACGGGAWPPLFHACASPFHARDASTADALAEVVRLLLAAGADPSGAVAWVPDAGAVRLPALYFACERGSAAVARVLLEHGAEPNDGESIYHAAQFDRRACLELLLAHGADVSVRHAAWGNTPLYFLLGHVEGAPGTATADRGIRWLLEHGADPEVTSGPLAESALHCAARVGRAPGMITLLIAHGARPSRARADGATPYALALRYGNDATVSALAGAGADVSRVGPLDRLLAACHAGDAFGARTILAAEPKLMEGSLEETHEQMSRAAARGNAPALELMLALGVPAHSEKPGASTPLHEAAWNGHARCVALLLARGALVNAREDEFGCSPLAWACHGSRHCREADEEYLAVVDQLLRAGADRASALNRWGLPPEAMARPAIATLLRDRGFAPAATTDRDDAS